MKKNFWQLIWESFNKINGWLIGFGGIAITILLTRFPFKTSIPFDLVLIISFFTLLLIAVLLDVVNTLLNQNIELISDLEREKNNKKILTNELNSIKIPKIIYAQKQGNKKILCLLEKSILFNRNQIVSVFYRDENGYECLIAVGNIVNIQSDGKIQAMINQSDQLELIYPDIFDRLGNNDHTVKDKIIIQPNIDKIWLSSFQGE